MHARRCFISSIISKRFFLDHSCVKTPTTTTNNAIKSTVTETTTLSSSKSPHNENILTDVNEEVTKEIPRYL